jgi:hypothetical protein
LTALFATASAEATSFLAAAATPDGAITLAVFAVAIVLFVTGWLAPEVTGTAGGLQGAQTR